MTNQQIENIEDINEAINPITPHINGSEGLEILGHNRNQSVNLLRFSRSFFKIYSHLTGLYSSIKSLTNGKEDKIVKNDAFNKNFGTNKGEVLEGHRMAQIQGVEKCGGDVQTPGVKKVGYSYWCTANKDFYVCKVENSLNYIDDAYFDAFSNAALLGKLQNLSIKNNIEVVASTNIPNGVLQITRTRVGNIAYFTAMATTNGATFEHTGVNFVDTYCRYRVLSSTSYAEDGNDLSIGLAGDENNSNIITANIRRMGANQPPAMVCKIILICEIL